MVRSPRPVDSFFVANMDPDDNIDDLLRLETSVTPLNYWGSDVTVRLRWWRSKNGRDRWREWKTYTWTGGLRQVQRTPTSAFAGRFGAAPGGRTLTVDWDRVAHVFSIAEIAAGRSPDWTATFLY